MLGAAVALLQPPPPGDLGDIEPRGAVTFQAAPSTWRLAIGEPPLVTAPSGESHRPSPHPFGLGSALVMYDPYEAPSSASRAFLVHQLGRLVSEQRELELEPDLLEDLFLYDLQGHRSIGGRDYPDLRVPASRVLGSRLATAAVLLLAALVAFGLIIRPGPARGVRQNVGYWFALSTFVGTQALQLRASSWANDHVDPLTSLSSRLVAYLGRYPELVLPAAVAAGVLLYRLLLRRFQQMEAPPPSKVSDTWFFQI